MKIKLRLLTNRLKCFHSWNKKIIRFSYTQWSDLSNTPLYMMCYFENVEKNESLCLWKFFSLSISKIVCFQKILWWQDWFINKKTGWQLFIKKKKSSSLTNCNIFLSLKKQINIFRKSQHSLHKKSGSIGFDMYWEW